MGEHDPIPLIVGAGPTGLILSLWLLKFSIPHRIIDAAPTTGLTSRAIVMHARSLEFYRQLGLADELLARGKKIEKFVIHREGVQRGVIPLADCGKDLTRFGFILSITQDEHEALLEETIVKRGGKVERSVKLVDAREDEGGKVVNVRLDVGGDGGGGGGGHHEEKYTASYVIGCDGAHSAVRHALGIQMEGGTYDKTFFVSDIVATGLTTAQNQMNLHLSRGDFMVHIPMPPEDGRIRLVGIAALNDKNIDLEAIEFKDLEPTLKRNARELQVQKVNWFSPYRVHHRSAAKFQQGRMFLCGDAAHIHSPVGGQGMNTGLGDATNLAWKLAAVCKGAHPALLDTYSAERIPFARKLVKTTDFAFTQVTSDTFLGFFIRNVMMPRILPIMLRLFDIVPFFFRKVSQLEIQYRNSPMSMDIGDTDAVKAGDRVPWIRDAVSSGVDNHESLSEAVWQAHVYGQASDWVKNEFQGQNLPLHCYTWRDEMGKAGLRRDNVYLIRPDGYIGLVADGKSSQQRQNDVNAYLRKWSVDNSKA